MKRHISSQLPLLALSSQVNIHFYLTSILQGSLYTNADAANQFLNVKAKDSLLDEDKATTNQYDKIKSALKKPYR